jgi:hypothetical protein
MINPPVEKSISGISTIAKEDESGKIIQAMEPKQKL